MTSRLAEAPEGIRGRPAATTTAATKRLNRDRNSGGEQKNDGGWCRCAECGRTFGGLYGFDLHRMDQTRDPYDWRCADDAELQAKELHLSAKGW